MNREAEAVISDILTQELTIPSGDIWIGNQNVKIPIDEEVYYIVRTVDVNVFSNTNQAVPTEAGMDEVQQLQARQNIQIDVLSASAAALTKRWLILLALRSVYSRQLQELEQFRIMQIPLSFVNTSGPEGGSEINRFSITIPCFVWYRIDQVIPDVNGDYYDTFETRVDDEDTIGEPDGLFEFTIDENTEI